MNRLNADRLIQRLSKELEVSEIELEHLIYRAMVDLCIPEITFDTGHRDFAIAKSGIWDSDPYPEAFSDRLVKMGRPFKIVDR